MTEFKEGERVVWHHPYHGANVGTVREIKHQYLIDFDDPAGGVDYWAINEKDLVKKADSIKNPFNEQVLQPSWDEADWREHYPSRLVASSNFHTERETKAWNLIIEAMFAIQNMDEHGTQLKYNDDELIGAIHVLQSFVKQHVLHRLAPDEYSDWWSVG
jgi:hypothetical protein